MLALLITFPLVAGMFAKVLASAPIAAARILRLACWSMKWKNGPAARRIAQRSVKKVAHTAALPSIRAGALFACDSECFWLLSIRFLISFRVRRVFASAEPARLFLSPNPIKKFKTRVSGRDS
jgi:hypothetical protein